MRLEVATFEMGTPKEAAMKVLEEAAEVYGMSGKTGVRREGIGHRLLADELADLVQAACNLAARYGIDMTDAMVRCRRRNEERGRYA